MLNLSEDKAMTIKYYLNGEYKTATVFTDDELRELMGTLESAGGSVADATVVTYK